MVIVVALETLKRKLPLSKRSRSGAMAAARRHAKTLADHAVREGAALPTRFWRLVPRDLGGTIAWETSRPLRARLPSFLHLNNTPLPSSYSYAQLMSRLLSPNGVNEANARYSYAESGPNVRTFQDEQRPYSQGSSLPIRNTLPPAQDSGVVQPVTPIPSTGLGPRGAVPPGGVAYPWRQSSNPRWMSTEAQQVNVSLQTPMYSSSLSSEPQSPRTAYHSQMYAQSPWPLAMQSSSSTPVSSAASSPRSTYLTRRPLTEENDITRLDPRYRRRPSTWFRVGRIFAIVWAEPAGGSEMSSGRRPSLQTTDTTPGRYGEYVYSRIRHFVVLRKGDTYCNALPIVTYNGQGVSKKGVNKAEHAIIYSGKSVPDPLPQERPDRGESGMLEEAIRYQPDEPSEKLHVASRINFGKVYTIEHNVKVRAIGFVHSISETAFAMQFKLVWEANMNVQFEPSKQRRGSSTVPYRRLAGSNAGKGRVTQASDDDSDSGSSDSCSENENASRDK